MLLYLISNIKINNKEGESLLDISIYRVEEVIKRNITGREIIKLGENVLIGYSKKELENGYYDLKITMSRETLDIHVNKAWKEYNDSLYEETYIDQIVNSIIDIFEMKTKNTHGYDKLYEYIYHGYKVSKGLIDKNLNDDNKLNVEEVILRQRIENNELVLSISKEVDR